jgi:ArsR family transcriptional regulator, arsenate/arsenite/antimonite-responsive transcriptional repressor
MQFVFYKNIIVILRYDDNKIMGISKTENFSELQNKVSNLAKALAHPARIAIIEHLLKVNSCICGDIVEELPLAQATVSQHLKAMKEVGIIKGSIEGKSICYCIDENGINDLKEYFINISEKLKQKNNCC